MHRRSVSVGVLAVLLLVFIGMAVSISSASPAVEYAAQRTPRGDLRTSIAATAGALQTNIAGTADALRGNLSGTADAARTSIAGTIGAAATQFAGTAQAYATQVMDRVGTAAPTMTAIRATLDAIPDSVPPRVLAFFEALEGQVSMTYDEQTGVVTVTSVATETQVNIAVDASASVLGVDPNSISVDFSAPNAITIVWIDSSSGNTYAVAYQMGITNGQFSATLIGLTINGRSVPLDQIPPVVATASGVVLESLNGIYDALGIAYTPQSITVSDADLTTVIAFTFAP